MIRQKVYRRNAMAFETVLISSHPENLTVEEEEPRVIPLTEEEFSVMTRTVETGRVRVSTRMLEHTSLARADLYPEDGKVEHVTIGREVVLRRPSARKETRSSFRSSRKSLS
jgi:stress response protein YsnF